MPALGAPDAPGAPGDARAEETMDHRFDTMRLTEPEPGIALLTLARPDRLNAISLQLLDEFHRVLDELETHPTARVLVLTGEGRGFCAGTDLKEAGTRHGPSRVDVEHAMHTQQKLSKLVGGLRRIPQPVIAAVNGVAAGGGFCFALAADVRVAAASARFVASFINIGLSGGEIGSTYLLPRLIGVSRAAEILYTGREVGADEAERIGLVSRVVPDGEALDAALQVARTMLGKSAFGLRMTKEVLDLNVDAPSLEHAMQLENRTQQLAVRTDAFVESVQAFAARKR
jgi:enoyl-CoA hydratase